MELKGDTEIEYPVRRGDVQFVTNMGGSMGRTGYSRLCSTWQEDNLKKIVAFKFISDKAVAVNKQRY